MSNFENTSEVSNLEASMLPSDIGRTQTILRSPAHSTGSGRKGSALLDYIPLWQRISGLRTETMDELDYEQRLIGLRKLMNEFERILREELNIPAQRGVYPLSALVKK